MIIHIFYFEKGICLPYSSSHVSTIGGNLLENSSVPKGLKYGTKKEYVIDLEVVTPTGEIIRTGGKTVKNVMGYDLTQLIVGSEGTLGVLTEAILRLIPKPQARKTMLASFAKLVDSGHAITKILTSGILPSAFELMVQACIQVVENYHPSGLPVDAETIHIIEVDGQEAALSEEINTCVAIFKEYGSKEVRVARDEA